MIQQVPTNQPAYPNPQHIFIKTKEAVVDISIPGLQQFFTNVNYDNNQDYAYFQLSYFDVPQEDNIELHLGTELFINVEIKIGYKKNVTGGADDVTMEDTNDLEFFTATNDVISIPLMGTTNAEQLAGQIKNAFFAMGQYAKFDYNEPGLLKPKSTMAIFMAHYRQFLYDPASGKFVFILAPSNMTRLNRPPMLDKANEGYSVHYIDIYLRPASGYSERGYQMWAQMFGGVLFNPTEPVAQFEMRTETLRNAYKKLVDNKLMKINNGSTVYDLTLLESSDLSTIEPLFLAPDYAEFYLYGENTPKLTTNTYVYVRCNCDSNMWTPDGNKLTTIAIVPRNRGFGAQISPESAFLTSNSFIKAPLASIKNMQLQFTDEKGDLIIFKGEIVAVISVHFNTAVSKE